ncbi:lipid-A-disaccharide synthase [Jannaschia pagri]|uniref:Lipid-A-disaccharide synthase n=1 Tax=Jannaschia pagri TaxID=2829797 RepID=A0ABQ4NN29_9RHOB|nr:MULTISPECIES: lipid-A-disaccharide synthase [unclassified Jannaschia]GIT91984.1 lipid-A-disaccharide synthase [Jannaschia sp. AI_61]GIT95818.1 lipid-A-disaccharide synthase [Jannaschia sp. AI_62]
MRLFLIAGEPSGDALGAALMAGMKQLQPGVTFAGVGGPAMQAEGLDSLFPMSDLSVMGLAEVLPRLRHLFRRRDQTVEAIADTVPDALVTIDSPDFCLRVAARAKTVRPSLPVIHYVAPSVWAWREGRAARMARTVDHVLALLPFEPPYMQAAGMTCDFVGHPVVAKPLASPAEADLFREEHGITGPLALVLPGSRGGEVGRLAPIFGEALAKLPRDARVVVPAVDHLAAAVRDAVRGWPGHPLVVTDPAEKRAAFGAATAALAASGTVSLELAANGVPMVIAYDMNWFSRQIIARMLKVDTVTLVNLVSETRAVPEFLGEACRPKAIGRAFNDLLLVPSQRARQVEALDRTMDRLGRGGEAPGLRAARSVLAAIGERTGTE